MQFQIAGHAQALRRTASQSDSSLVPERGHLGADLEPASNVYVFGLQRNVSVGEQERAVHLEMPQRGRADVQNDRPAIWDGHVSAGDWRCAVPGGRVGPFSCPIRSEVSENAQARERQAEEGDPLSHALL